ncbi:MAG: GTPase [Nocardioidaceae bacterium]
MSAVVETLRRLTGRSSDVVERVEGLQRAAEAAQGRLDPASVTGAQAVVEQVASRLRLSGEHTVVALAGATGSGKSSLFNALCGLDLAAVGVKRPTTSWALACAWGPEGANELLDWLGIPKRHQVNRMGMLDETAADKDLQGLVLLDLPDHDSTELSHHLEVDRLVQLADVLIWVLDPQKYADAAIHDRFLRPLQSHAEVMMVALNHVDEISESDARSCMSDLHRLLQQDGLHGVPVFATSASRGDGLAELRRALVERVSQKKFARERLTADVKAAATSLAEQTGSASAPDVRASARGDLTDALQDAAGVEVVVGAIEAVSLMRGRRATGWPLVSWVGGLRPDPLRKLKLTSKGAPVVAQTNIPVANSVQRARVDGAVRSASDTVSADLPKPWGASVRAASLARIDDVARSLDSAVSGTDLGLSRDPWWWRLVRVLQWVLCLAALAGAVWLATLAVLAYLQMSAPDPAHLGPLPIPTLLLVGGIAAGLVLAVVCRVGVQISARRRARRAQDRLQASIQRVSDGLIVAPMQAEIDAYVRCRDGLAVALRR